MMANVRKPMVAGNWKMNGSLALLKSFTDSLESSSTIDTVLCLPAPYLTAASKGDFALGAQDCSQFESGAHTGDISVSMLKELGVEYIIIGHSERRQDHAESNIVVAEKVQTVINAGLIPILCVGEPLEVREANQQNEFVLEQLQAVQTICGNEFIDNCVIAYEPIWAIGTGKTASPEQAQEVHKFIRTELLKWNSNAANTQLLYGGSVNASNAEALFANEDIDGGLIGGASLKLEDFAAICKAAG
ncbi:triose-phosphate isomerase [Glaciecola sp. 2405UD65-10]|uniref:triose-phosphate isomerase n=1 Tax=Glaciecola sp. 2405UD65-10 TaxID=3397244 RepID=UPI003B5B40BD